MALVRFNFSSKYLGNYVDVNILLPDRPRDVDPKTFYSTGEKFKVLWLLHGTGADCNEWMLYSRIPLFAAERNLACVMVSGMNSNYVNWPKFGMGYNFWDFFTEELMPAVYGWFPISDKREDNFIGGLSMGGRGTSYIAFGHPELFAGAAILSACPVEYTEENSIGDPRTRPSVENCGGLEGFLASPENIWDIAPRLMKEGVQLPKLYFATGGDDKIIMDRLEKWRPYADSLGLEATYEVIPGYGHEWRIWDIAIEKALDLFGIEKNGTTGPV